MAASRPPLVVTLGEPAGIGLDVTLAVWRDRARLNPPVFYLRGDADALRRRADRLGLSIPLVSVEPEAARKAFPEALPVAPLGAVVSEACGAPDPRDADAVLDSIRASVDDVTANRAAAIVTNPINKKTLYDAGFPHPGHTEFLAALAAERGAESAEPVMMLAGPDLRVVPVTIHMPLRDVPQALTTEMIVRKAEIVARDLARRFGLRQPRFAVAGLNPHAGEGGALGREDGEIITQAVATLVARGHDVRGPLPADTMFHAAARATYDVALCMYHDQALIPAKTLDFAETVNVTLGLPFVRTSPDHGTALALAGTGKADPAGLLAALKMADRLAATDHA